MPLAQILSDYRTAVAGAQAVIALSHVTDASGAYSWSYDGRSIVTEAAVIKVFVAWESFLEAAFCEYLMGQPSIAGNSVGRYASPTNDSHAKALLLGTTKFVDWSAPDTVRKLAGLYFANGHPFETVLAAIHGDLLDLKTIRNAAAHLSSTTSTALDALATRRLGMAVGRISVYEFILHADPSSATGDTILQYYLSRLDTAALGIANA